MEESIIKTVSSLHGGSEISPMCKTMIRCEPYRVYTCEYVESENGCIFLRRIDIPESDEKSITYDYGNMLK